MEDESRVAGMRAEQDEPEVEAHMLRENEEPTEDDSEAGANTEQDVEAHMRNAGRAVNRNSV